MCSLSWSTLLGLVGVPVGLICVVNALLTNRKRINIEGKVVLITGATSGLGKACAACFHEAGCRVILCGRVLEKLIDVQEELKTLRTVSHVKYEPQILVLDLENLSAIPSKAEEAISLYGNIDILINNAGISFRGQIKDTSTDVHGKLLNVNYLSQVALIKAILPSMLNRKSGSIVGVSSVQGRLSIPYRSAYSASKHAMQAFYDCLRAEVADRDITVCVINPGYIRTNLSMSALREDGSCHNVMDKTTVSGMDPEKVAQRILTAVIHQETDIVLASFIQKLAVYIRILWPNLYFWLMISRANKERHMYLKMK